MSAAPPPYNRLENEEDSSMVLQSNTIDSIGAFSNNSQYADAPPPYTANLQQQDLPSGVTPSWCDTSQIKSNQRPKFMDDIDVATPTSHVNQSLITINFGESPARCFCPTCHQHIITATENEAGTHTWAMCCLICFFCGILPGLIPFCVPDCQDVRHTCPNCKKTVAVFER